MLVTRTVSEYAETRLVIMYHNSTSRAKLNVNGTSDIAGGCGTAQRAVLPDW